MPKVKNVSDGPRGAYLKGVLHMAEVGEVIEADDYAKDWFKPTKGDESDDDKGGKPLSAMNKSELLDAAAAAGVVDAQDNDGQVISVADATNKQIIAAIEAKQAAPAT